MKVSLTGMSLVLSWFASSANSTSMSSCTRLSMRPTKVFPPQDIVWRGSLTFEMREFLEQFTPSRHLESLCGVRRDHTPEVGSRDHVSWRTAPILQVVAVP